MGWFFKTRKIKSTPRILMAAVLKSARDIRTYHKLGKSLADLFPNYEIHSLGSSLANYSPQAPPSQVQVHELSPFSRFSWARIQAAWKMWRLACKLKPRVLVLSAGELLPWGLLYRIYPGGYLIYDVQENYFRNILYTQAYPFWVRSWLAYAFRGMEWLTSWGVQGFILAEKCYGEEISFIRKPYIFLPNKMDRSQLPAGFKASPAPQKMRHFLLTGTLSADYGLFDAIAWAYAYQQVLPDIRLSICGHVPRFRDYKRLQSLGKKYDFLHLAASPEVMPYGRIIEAMQACDAVLLPYRVNRSVENRIPTKIYECLALRKPMIVQPNPFWEAFLAKNPFQSAIFWDFAQLTNLEELRRQIHQTHFYQNAENIPHIYWQEEEEALRQFFLPWLSSEAD